MICLKNINPQFYNLMMHFTNNSLGLTESPIFSINKLSPYLSPMLDYQPRKNSIVDQQLLQFNLEQPQPHEVVQLRVEQQHQIISEPQSHQSMSSEVQGSRRKQSKNRSNGTNSMIQNLVEYLVENSGLSQDELLERGRNLIKENRNLYDVYVVLMRKFKKLKKTKEQLTKYCMRKAFKFVSDRMRKDQHETNSKEVDQCLKVYFSGENFGNSFSIPFKFNSQYYRKNSHEKTMNNTFLKKVFNSQGFLQDYRIFLTHFQNIMEEDNRKKIKYISDLIEELMTTNSVKKMEGIKRLPWTRNILSKTQQVSYSLISHAESSNV